MSSSNSAWTICQPFRSIPAVIPSPPKRDAGQVHEGNRGRISEVVWARYSRRMTALGLGVRFIEWPTWAQSGPSAFLGPPLRPLDLSRRAGVLPDLALLFPRQ